MRELSGWCAVILASTTWLAACSGADGQAAGGNGGTAGGSGGTAGGSGGTAGGSGDGDFVSDEPALGGQNRGAADAGAAAGGTTSATPSESAGDAAREIAEADIVQVEGTRLYALSRYGGLSVIDVGTRDRLSLLGRFRMEATPFEMYVRGTVVLAMFSGWGDYVTNASGGYDWVQTSRVVALDTADPANIRVLGNFEVPGSISDSRTVGDVLYVVSHEDGYCWRCEANNPRTSVLSLDVKDPRSLRKVDQLAFADVNDQWGWGPRSITVTDQRLYVAGREYSQGRQGSTIQVVDISDPAGDMKLGAAVEAKGEITSRWQMDEFDGVLRVVSQPPQWDLTEPPSVQTFRVTSAAAVTPLGSTALVLPRPEQLQTVRMDGARGYAITSERTDPLFTLDLSDPARPRQLGQLEMPGWIYHLEPRGDRLVGLGYDQNNPQGSITVSLFDVQNLAQPKMIERVNFGGSWGSLAEDQDRIHKSFQVLDAAQLILVPFSGTTTDTCQRYTSGVQLIDFIGDDLTLRGVAPSYGQARRALLHEDRLFTVSDDRVQTFDIANRSAPAAKAKLALAQNVTQTAVSGDTVVRLGQDWWSNGAVLDVTTVAQASKVGLPSLDITLTDDQCGYAYPEGLFVDGTSAFVLAQQYDYRTNQQRRGVRTVDISNPAAPRLTASYELPTSESWYGYSGGFVTSGAPLVQAGHAIARQSVSGSWKLDPTSSYSTWVLDSSAIEVIDTRNPNQLTSTRLELPATSAGTGLHAAGDGLVMGRYAPLADGSGRVRFFIDRIDVSDPSAPRLEWSINVPGSLYAWDEAHQRALTVDYVRHTYDVATYTECYETYGGFSAYTPEATTPSGTQDWSGPGTCTTLEYSLKLVRIEGGRAYLEGTHALAKDEYPGRAAMGDGVAYVSVDRGNAATMGDGVTYVSVDRGYAYGVADCLGACGGSGSVRSKADVLVLQGLAEGRLEASRLKVEGDDWGAYVSTLVASGQRALVSTGWRGSLSVLDAAATPRVHRTVDTVGYVNHVSMSGSRAVLSLGMDGAAVVDLAAN